MAKVYSAESRKRISEGVKRWYTNHPMTPEAKRKMSEALKRSFAENPERRKKISEALKGRRVSTVTRQKISETRKRWYLQHPPLRGIDAPAWKGGRHRTKDGYIQIYKKEHPRATGGYVYQHILVWEETHSRCLPEGYLVHHLNGIKDDNRLENLVAIPRENHHGDLLFQALKERIRKLEAENRKLKAQRELWR